MIKPPRFEGKDSCLESHLVKFEIVAKRNRWDEFEKADFLKCSLSGEASHLLRDLSDSATYDDVIYKLRQRYGSLEQIESFRMELKQRKRKPGESLTNLLKDIRRLFALAFPGPPNYLSELTAKDAFIDALGDRELMIKVLEREPSTLDQAFKIAERLELYRNIPGERDTDSKTKPVSKVRASVVDDDSVLKSIIETQKLMQKQLTVLTESLPKERSPAYKPFQKAKAPASKLKGLCHLCQKPGHYRPQCHELIKKSAEETNVVESATRGITSEQRNDVDDTDLPLTDTIMESGPEVAPSFQSDSQPPQSAWMNYMRTFPPPPFPLISQQVVLTAANWSTQPTQLSPEVVGNWSTQPTQLSPDVVGNCATQPTQPSPEVVGNWSTQPTQPSPEVTAKLTTQLTQLSSSNKPAVTTQLTQLSSSNKPAVMTQLTQLSSSNRPAVMTQLTQPRLTAIRRGNTSELFGETVDKKSKATDVTNDKGVYNTGNTLFIEVKIGKKRCSALLDTGSEVTLLPKHLADLSQLNRSSRKLRAANGTIINILGEWCTKVTLGPLQESKTESTMNDPGTEERPVGCPSCDSRFKGMCDWYRHNRAVHLRIGVLCPECDHRMSSMGVLSRHLRTQHGIKSEYRVPRGPHRTRTARVQSYMEPATTISRAPDTERAPVETAVSRRVQEGNGTYNSETVPARVPSASARPSEDSLVSFEREVGYVAVEPEVRPEVVVERPVRYLDLIPTAPERREMLAMLTKWRERILWAIPPLNKEDLLSQFREEAGDLGFPALLAVENLIDLKSSIDAVAQPAATTGDSARRSKSALPGARPYIRVCTDLPVKDRSRSKGWSVPKKPATKPVATATLGEPETDDSTILFKALGEKDPTMDPLEKESASCPSTEQRVEDPNRIQHDSVEKEPKGFEFLEEEIFAACEEEI